MREDCECCGGPALTWFAPNPLWNLVQGGPTATDDPGGMLCPNCFIRKAEAAGVVPTAWILDRENLLNEVGRWRGGIKSFLQKHGATPLDPNVLAAYVSEMESTTIPAIEASIQKRQFDAATNPNRHAPLYASPDREAATREAVTSLLAAAKDKTDIMVHITQIGNAEK